MASPIESPIRYKAIKPFSVAVGIVGLLFESAAVVAVV